MPGPPLLAAAALATAPWLARVALAAVALPQAPAAEPAAAAPPAASRSWPTLQGLPGWRAAPPAWPALGLPGGQRRKLDRCSAVAPAERWQFRSGARCASARTAALQARRLVPPCSQAQFNNEQAQRTVMPMPLMSAYGMRAARSSSQHSRPMSSALSVKRASVTARGRAGWSGRRAVQQLAEDAVPSLQGQAWRATAASAPGAGGARGWLADWRDGSCGPT